ncbi:hypothetical protein FPV67DRAFT_1415931 [Lyophyllum atratum]|nr:hypothetical protein FPV67DRAFT_1415931 [Lyophyllum atratum]
MPLHSARQVDRNSIHTLRRPSQYIGFDTIPRPSPPIPRNLTNFPFAVAQIDSAEARKVFETETKRYLSLSGTVYPDDKKVISTVVQFRAIDYGMEACDVHITLAPARASLGHVEAISLYRLESATPLDLETLSHRTSPRRLGRIADIQAVLGSETHWHRKMSCSMEEVLTFELACPHDIPVGTICDLEWWQTKEESTPGWSLTVSIFRADVISFVPRNLHSTACYCLIRDWRCGTNPPRSPSLS